jgi:hypothetical protein
MVHCRAAGLGMLGSFRWEDGGVSAITERVVPPRGMRQLAINSVYGLMVVPYCPHEGCGWSMPELFCQDHGNFGMTFLSVQVGVLTHVKAVLDRPAEPAQTNVAAT